MNLKSTSAALFLLLVLGTVAALLMRARAPEAEPVPRDQASPRYQALVQSPRGPGAESSAAMSPRQQSADQQEKAFLAAFSDWYQPPQDCQSIESDTQMLRCASRAKAARRRFRELYKAGEEQHP